MSVSSVSPRDLHGPSAVVGVVTRDTNFICFAQAPPCFQPSVASLSICSLSKPLTLTRSHMWFYTHTCSHVHSLVLTCAHTHMFISHPCPHARSHTHSSLPLFSPPMALDSSCPFSSPCSRTDQLLFPGPPVGPFPGGCFLAFTSLLKPS